MRIKKMFLCVMVMALSLSACGRIESQAGPSGTKAAEFTLKTVDGKEITLSDELKNKKAVLVFGASWCPYCVKEIPEVNAFYSANKDKVSVIGIDIQESE
ncbi:MAG: TlpA disulfide reductase family protein, partial [Candidatus Omnitrophota bacterium]